MKKITLYVSLGLTLILLALILVIDILRLDICSNSCRDIVIDVGESMFFFPVVFMFSLITYFAPERVFASWWKFARVAIPVAFIANALLMYDMSQSTDAFDDIVYIPVLILIYGSFILGSAWQIWKGWRNK